MADEIKDDEQVIIRMSAIEAKKLASVLETCFKNERAYAKYKMNSLENLYDQLMGLNPQ
ncbi:MAG: hypothetical protein P9L97_05655 [Candidatus Tenebribacter davisii]|nr:hypothetical protein [Candidatus Tenebribacter davisii]